MVLKITTHTCALPLMIVSLRKGRMRLCPSQSGSRPYGGSVIDPHAHLSEIAGQIGLDLKFRVSRWAPAKAEARRSARGAAAPQTVNMCSVRAGAVRCVYRSRFLACLVTGLGL